jgi:hypothetical protein
MSRRGLESVVKPVFSANVSFLEAHATNSICFFGAEKFTYNVHVEIDRTGTTWYG